MKETDRESGLGQSERGRRVGQTDGHRGRDWGEAVETDGRTETKRSRPEVYEKNIHT